MKTLLNHSFLFSLKLLNFQFQLVFIENLITFLYLQNLRNNLIATHSTSLSDDRNGAILLSPALPWAENWDPEIDSNFKFSFFSELKSLTRWPHSPTSRQSKVEARQLSVCFTSYSLAVFPFWNQGKIKNYILFFENLFISKPSFKFLEVNFL